VRGRLEFGVVSVTLRPVTDAEFDAWLPSVQVGYAEHLIMDGSMDPEAARVKAAAEKTRSRPPSSSQWPASSPRF
jgi:hypothetical protein